MAFARRAEIELATNNRRLQAGLRQAQGEIQGFGKQASGSVGNAFKTALGGFAAFGTGAGIAALGKEVLDTEEKLTRMGIQAGASDSQISNLRATATQVGRDFGMTRAEVLGAVEALTDLQGTAGFDAQKMTTLAKAAQATGAPIKDLAGVAFALGHAFKLEGGAGLEGALNAVINAGKEGSVPLGEMSVVLQQLSTQFAALSASGKDGAADLAAAIQVARLGFGSAGEAGTGISQFIGELSQKASKLREIAKVEVFEKGADGVKRLRPLREILDQIENSELIRDPEKMSDVFGSKEAKQFLNVLIANRDKFDEMSEKARNANDIQTDSQKFLASTAGRMKVAVAEARAEMEALITPERLQTFVGLAERLVQGLGMVAPALDFAATHMARIAVVAGTIKLAPLLVATNQWGQSMQGIAQSATSATGAIGSANTQAAGLGRVTGGLAGGFARAASYAGGIASSLFAGYQFGTMLVEQAGWFKDQTLVQTSADDKEGNADKAQKYVDQRKKKIAELEQANADLERGKGTTASLKFRKQRTGMGPDIDYDAAIESANAKIVDNKRQIEYERSQLRNEQNMAVATKIFERDRARGTGAVDNIITEGQSARAQTALARVGSGFGVETDLSKNDVYAEYAPELSSLGYADQGAVIGLLRQMLEVQQRQEALQQKVASTNTLEEVAAKAVADAASKFVPVLQMTVEMDGQKLGEGMSNTQAANRAPAQ